jgi:hypothetical protein
MPRLALIAAAAAALALGGCASQQDIVASREELLAAAGFRIQPANTPAAQADLARLPPHRLAWEQRDGKLTFLYADPLVCHCVFVGTERAYQIYQQMEFQRQVAATNYQAAQMYYNAAGWWPGGWGWGYGYGWWR